MILLLGGTSETPRIANLLAEKNVEVLVSNLSEYPVDWQMSEGIRLRHGGLDVEDMCELIEAEGVTVIVDAGHPYAEKLHGNAIKACSKMKVLYCRYERPGVDYAGYDVEFADDHQSGAERAFEIGQRALLTTGSRNLEPYVRAMRDAGAKLYVRVLPCAESLANCREFGIGEDALIAERGPFTTEQNIELIKKHSIDVLVTKDSGEAGGVIEKLEAARFCGIKVVVIKRPFVSQTAGESFNDICELVKTVVGKDKSIGA